MLIQNTRATPPLADRSKTCSCRLPITLCWATTVLEARTRENGALYHARTLLDAPHSSTGLSERTMMASYQMSPLSLPMSINLAQHLHSLLANHSRSTQILCSSSLRLACSSCSHHDGKGVGADNEHELSKS